MRLAPRLSRALARDSVFYGLVALALLLAVLFLYLFRADFAVLARQALRLDDPEVARWERWAGHNEQLFGALPWGEPVGVQVEGARSSGILLTRTGDGMTVERRLFLKRAEPGVVLSMSRETADDLLEEPERREPGAIWQTMKDLLYGRQLTLWADPDVERLQEDGYLAFMRAIDTRPADVPWPAVKVLLGENPQPPEIPESAEVAGASGS